MFEWIEDCFLEEEEYDELMAKYGILPRFTFEGGAIIEDEADYNMWIIFDKEPTITLAQFGELCKEHHHPYLSNDCNPEDYKTWIFWMNQEDAEYDEEEDW